MATGGSFILGKDNEADHVTYVALIGGKFKTNTYALRAQAGNPNSNGARGDASDGGMGLDGISPKGIGVRGMTSGFNGSDSIGVLGEAVENGGTGVRAKAKSGTAVYAAAEGYGVFGRGRLAGVEGLSIRKGGIGVWGHTLGEGVLAGRFDGPVLVKGDFTVTNGVKSAAVPFPDGTLRRLYCVESPESWFEDFGEARLVRGRAQVRIKDDFAAVVEGPYHVFLTPHGDSNGLFVQARRRKSFVVREQARGTSTLAFSYRIVARRKDVRAPRMQKVQAPPSPKSAALPEDLPRRRR